MIKLVPITPADFPKLISWAASEEFLLQWTGRTFKYPLDENQINEYYQLSVGNRSKRLILKAADEENEKHIGNITIDWVNSGTGEAALTCIIIGDEDYKGKGIGEFIVNEACKIAFKKHGIKKLSLNVFDFNKPAIRCYQKCGFEEAFRERLELNGKEYVNVRMELLRTDILNKGA